MNYSHIHYLGLRLLYGVSNKNGNIQTFFLSILRQIYRLENWPTYMNFLANMLQKNQDKVH